MRRKTYLDATEKERDSNSTKTNTAIKRIPAGDLRACLQYVGEFERNDAQDRIMLAVALIPNSHGDDSGAPIAYEALGTGIEDGLA